MASSLDGHRARALAEGWPILVSIGVLVAATSLLRAAPRSAAVHFPPFVTPEIVWDAVGLPAAWIASAATLAGIVAGVVRRSHVALACGLLSATAIVYFHTLSIWLEPVTGIVDVRGAAMVAWLYMPQAAATACLIGHVVIFGAHLGGRHRCGSDVSRGRATTADEPKQGR